MSTVYLVLNTTDKNRFFLTIFLPCSIIFRTIFTPRTQFPNYTRIYKKETPPPPSLSHLPNNCNNIMQFSTFSREQHFFHKPVSNRGLRFRDRRALNTINIFTTNVRQKLIVSENESFPSVCGSTPKRSFARKLNNTERK